MKLYYAVGTCSFAPHVALREAGLDPTLVRFDMKTQSLSDGAPITDVNPKGYVPVLELDDGTRLTEVAAILQYIADQHPTSKLAPPAGTLARYRLIEHLHYIGMEIHKIFWPLFHQGEPVENDKARSKLSRSLSFIQDALGDSTYLMGDDFTVADAYLVTVLNWTKPAGIDLSQWPRLFDYWKRVRARPAVQAALAGEGLLRPKAA